MMGDGHGLQPGSLPAFPTSLPPTGPEGSAGQPEQKRKRGRPRKYEGLTDDERRQRRKAGARHGSGTSTCWLRDAAPFAFNAGRAPAVWCLLSSPSSPRAGHRQPAVGEAQLLPQGKPDEGAHFLAPPLLLSLLVGRLRALLNWHHLGRLLLCWRRRWRMRTPNCGRSWSRNCLCSHSWMTPPGSRPPHWPPPPQALRPMWIKMSSK